MNANDNANTFGVNIWWTVPGLTVPVDMAHRLLEVNGFEKDDMKEPSDRKEVSRAVKSFQKLHGKDDRKMAEKAHEDDKAVVYGILDRQQEGSDEVAFVQKTKVTYDKNRNTVNVEGVLAGAVELAIANLKDKMTDQDIRYFLRNLVRMCNGVAKRPSGGIYFIPHQFVGIVEQAQKFLADLSEAGGLAAPARLYVERVVDGVAERQIVWEAVEAGIDDNLQTILAGVERVEKRVGALKNQEAKVEELRGLMKVYQDLLGKEAEYEEVTGKLDAAVQTIANKMTAIQNVVQGVNAVAVPDAGAANGFEEAVVAVLKANDGPLPMTEIEKRVRASGFAGKYPERVDGFFNNRVKNGTLTRVSRGVYGLAKAA